MLPFPLKNNGQLCILFAHINKNLSIYCLVLISLLASCSGEKKILISEKQIVLDWESNVSLLTAKLPLSNPLSGC